MSEKRDYYKILGVPPIAGKEEIKKAYKQQAKQFHPDLNPDNRLYAEEKMKELSEAYDVLMDPIRRQEYGLLRHFTARVPSQLKRSGSPNNALSKELEKKNESFIEKIKNFFHRKADNSGSKEMPKEVADRFAMGITYLARNEENMLQLAKSEFQAVIEQMPDNKYALYNIGLIFYKLGCYDDALLMFKKLLSMNSKDPDVIKMTTLLRND